MNKDFIILNYYYQSNKKEIDIILNRGFLDYHNTRSIFGYCLELTSVKRDNNVNFVLNVDLKNVDNLIFVQSRQQIIDFVLTYVPGAQVEFDNNGLTNNFGKFVTQFVKLNGLNGFKIIDENLLVLYNYKNIDYIGLLDIEKKIINPQNYPPDPLTHFILQGNVFGMNANIEDHEGNSLVYGNV